MECCKSALLDAFMGDKTCPMRCPFCGENTVYGCPANSSLCVYYRGVVTCITFLSIGKNVQHFITFYLTQRHPRGDFLQHSSQLSPSGQIVIRSC